MTRNLLLLAAVLLPAACGHAPSMEELASNCTASGYASGTEGGLLCLQMAVQQESTRQAVADQRRMAAAMMLGAMGQRIGQPQPNTFQPPLRMQTSCRPNPFTGGFVCN